MKFLPKSQPKITEISALEVYQRVGRNFWLGFWKKRCPHIPSEFNWPLQTRNISLVRRSELQIKGVLRRNISITQQTWSYLNEPKKSKFFHEIFNAVSSFDGSYHESGIDFEFQNGFRVLAAHLLGFST